MRARFVDRGAGERGFILVGVVTFMLALTILGLSLFALSSFEAQFFGASVAREQAFHHAESGMELAKVLLARSPSPQRLEAVREAVGQLGVTSALAYQQRGSLPDDTTSVGPMDWEKSVTLVVSARSGGVERTFKASYWPGENPYRRLLTAGNGVEVNTEVSSSPSSLEIRGGVWHPVGAAQDTSWTGDLTWPEGRPVQTNVPPQLQANAFVDAHLADPRTGEPPLEPAQVGTGFELKLEGSGDAATFFRSPSSTSSEGDGEEYSFYAHRALRIFIRGTVVWVARRGVSFGEGVEIVPLGNEPSTLVIVAKRNGRDDEGEDLGIKFKGGLVLDPNTHLYLVSEGDISITNINTEDENHDAFRVSMVAGGRIELGGPEVGHRFRLTYDADEMDPLAEQLLSRGALPSLVVGASPTFELVRSTWAETTPP